MFETVLRRLWATGWRRGRDGSRAWMIVAAAAAMGSGVRSLEGGVRVAAALAIGAVLGYAAEFGAEKMREFQKGR